MLLDGQNPNDLPQSLVYNPDGTLAYVEVTTPTIPGVYSGGVYRQSFTYTSGNLTSISGWVKQ